MKIFKNEDNKEVVYVQMQDMGFLNSIDDPIPASIFMQVFGNGVTMIGEKNRFNYVRFEQEKEVEFFRNIEAITDYDEFANLNLEEIEAKATEVGNRINEIVEQYNSMSQDERKKNNTKMLEDCEKLKYKYQWIATIYLAKHNNEKLPMPNESIQKKKHFGKRKK